MTIRIEHDFLGEVKINQEDYFGSQTQRAKENFDLSGQHLSEHPELIRALALVKQACAKTNRSFGSLSQEKFEAIEKACLLVLSGKYDSQFPIDMIQGGAGTSTNMNMNEVLANVGLELMGKDKGDYQCLHPNSDVNMSQSTNDVYPTAIRLSILLKQSQLLEQLSLLMQAFETKSEQFKHILKLARTQLQDAVPITLGQEFHGFYTTLKEDHRLLQMHAQLLHEVNLGGTAVGTGINTKSGYAEEAVAQLSQISGFTLIAAEDLVEASSDMGAFVTYSSSLKRLAIKLSKIANDIRLLSMGPRAGIGEISLPARQAGSSIMPGKVNPVIPEAVSQVAYQIVGKDAAISMAAEAGQLQLNAMEPLIGFNLLSGIDLLTNAIVMFREFCIEGIEANEGKCESLLNNSLAMATALNPYLGYETSTKVAKIAMESNRSLLDVVREQKLLTEEQLSQILVPQKMTQPLAD